MAGKLLYTETLWVLLSSFIAVHRLHCLPVLMILFTFIFLILSSTFVSMCVHYIKDSCVLLLCFVCVFFFSGAAVFVFEVLSWVPQWISAAFLFIGSPCISWLSINKENTLFREAAPVDLLVGAEASAGSLLVWPYEGYLTDRVFLAPIFPIVIVLFSSESMPG